MRHGAGLFVAAIDRSQGRASSPQLQLLYVGQIGPDEHLLRLMEGDVGNDQTVLKPR